ncbi:MAG: pilus assembly protein PilM [Planctomycetota bacterium]
MLAIDWNNHEIRFVEGKSTRGSIKVSQAVAIPIPADLDPSDAVAWGSFIKQSLKASGLHAKTAVTCLERRSLVLKTVPLAGVAEEEVSDVVRLQAMRDLTIPLEEMTLDYLRVAPATAAEEPHALLAAVKTELIDFYRQVFQSAGLTLVGLWPGSLARVRIAAVSGVLPTPTDEGIPPHALLIVVEGDTVELSLLHGDHFLMSVSRQISRGEPSSTPAQRIQQVVHRLYSSLSSQYPGLRVGTVVCAGLENPGDAFGEAMRTQIGVEPVMFDPLASLADSPIPPEQRGAFASVVGSVVIASDSASQRINFLTPKRSVPKQDRRRLVAIGLIGAVLLGGFQLHRYYTTRRDSLEAAIKKAKSDEAKMKKQLKQFEPIKAQASLLENWRQQEVVWLNLLKDFFENVPEAKHMFVTQMSLARSHRTGGPIATVRIEGFADTQGTVSELTRRLMGEGIFEVHPGAIQPSGRFQGYPWRFSADIGVRRPPPSPTATAARNRAPANKGTATDRPTRLTPNSKQP